MRSAKPPARSLSWSPMLISMVYPLLGQAAPLGVLKSAALLKVTPSGSRIDPVPVVTLRSQVALGRFAQARRPPADEEDRHAQAASVANEVQRRGNGLRLCHRLPGAKPTGSLFEVALAGGEAGPAVHAVGRPVRQRCLVDVEDGRGLRYLSGAAIEVGAGARRDRDAVGGVAARVDVGCDPLLGVKEVRDGVRPRAARAGAGEESERDEPPLSTRGAKPSPRTVRSLAAVTGIGAWPR